MMNEAIAMIQSAGHPAVLTQIILGMAVLSVLVWGIHRTNKIHDDLDDILSNHSKK